MTSAPLAGLLDGKMSASSAQPRPRPGRPRDSSIEQRLLTAAVELLLETDDESHVTVGAITARSGVSRAALYRRWPTRDALLAAALDSVRRRGEYVDTGSLEGDLLALIHQHVDDADDRMSDLVCKRIIMGLRDPALQRTTWEKHVSLRREPMLTAFRQAIARGEIGPETDVAACMDMLVGSSYYQFVVRPLGHPDTVPVERTIRALCAMLRSGARDASPQANDPGTA